MTKENNFWKQRLTEKIDNFVGITVNNYVTRVRQGNIISSTKLSKRRVATAIMGKVVVWKGAFDEREITQNRNSQRKDRFHTKKNVLRRLIKNLFGKIWVKMHAEVYLRPYQTYMMKLFCVSSYQLTVTVNYLSKKHRQRCLKTPSKMFKKVLITPLTCLT